MSAFVRSNIHGTLRVVRYMYRAHVMHGMCTNREKGWKMTALHQQGE